ncbi:MAG: hypothetical protein E7404_01930 [Ruminococcaceae bacterium]|nr:hypothetical protein [Oscillospiraceae bacterium]
MRNRIIFGAVIFLTAILITVVGKTAVSIAISIIALMALSEMYKSLKFFKEQKILSAMGILYAFLIMLFATVKAISSTLDFNSFTHVIFKTTLAFLVVLLIYMVVRFEKVKFSCVTSFFVITAYITVFLAHIILIECQNHGNALIWFVFFGAWGTDTCAYFAGRFFGRHKLIENVSPKKTIEGAIGGAVGTVIIFAVYAFCLSCAGLKINYINLIITAVICAVISQFGDLIASCIKRENNIKDYGSLIPGHGGILDRFDSVITLSPLVFYLGFYLPIIL